MGFLIPPHQLSYKLFPLLSTLAYSHINMLTSDEVLRHVPGTNGLMSNLAKKVGVTRIALIAFAEKHPEIYIALNEEKEKVLDDVESALIDKAKEGIPWATQYYLNEQGHTRGYGVPQFNEVKGFTLKVVYGKEIEANNDDFKQLPPPDQDKVLILDAQRNNSESEKTSQETSGVYQIEKEKESN